MKNITPKSPIVVFTLLFCILVTGIFIGSRSNRRFLYAEEVQQMEQERIEIPPLDINTATAEQFARLDGISEELAARIVDNRSSRGWYDSVDRLLNVEGFTQSLLDSLRDRLIAVKP